MFANLLAISLKWFVTKNWRSEIAKRYSWRYGVRAVCPPIFPAYIYYVYHIDIIYKKYVLTEINRKLKFSSLRMKLILMELRTIYGIYRVNTR